MRSLWKALPLGVQWSVGAVVFLVFVWPFVQPLTDVKSVTARREMLQGYSSTVIEDVKGYANSVSTRANEWYAENSTAAKEEILAAAEAARKNEEAAALTAVATKAAEAAERRAEIDLMVVQTLQDLRAQLSGPREAAQVDVDVRVHNRTKDDSL